MKHLTSHPADQNPSVALTGESVFLTNLHHAYAQTDGSYSFPNSREGDMLKTAKREIEQLIQARRVMVEALKLDSLANRGVDDALAAFRAAGYTGPANGGAMGAFVRAKKREALRLVTGS